MIPHYGKREPGLLTAASPGDTLYFPFASYNDSGDSEALTGLAVTDIEVIKNGLATVRATDSGYSLISDTGMVGDRAGLYRVSIQLFNTADDASFYASGSWYQAFIDAVTIDGRTVRFWLGSWEIGRQRVDVRELIGDTGAANWLQQTYAAGFADTGINDRLGRIGFDVDTGLRAQISDVDTGLHDTIADQDTGLRGILQTTGVNVNWIDGDTGAANQLLQAFATTPTYFQQVDVQRIDADTGAAAHLQQSADSKANLLVDVREVNTSAGAASFLATTFQNGFHDTGINERFGRIQSDVDTGLRVHIDDSDTGIKDALADLDTGLRDYIDNTDTGLRAILQTTGVNVTKLVGDTGAANWLKTVYSAGFTDTGLYSRLDKLAEDTGGVNINSIQGDTGAAGWLKATYASGFTDTGLYNRLDRIQSDVDTGLRVHIDDSDTGVKDAIADLDTGLRDYIDNTDTGLRRFLDNMDTGIKNRFDDLAEDTGGVNITAIAGDTGAAGWLKATYQSGFHDTGLNDRLTDIQTQTDKLTFDTGNELRVDVRKVNNVTVQGDGQPGTEWRPGT